MKIRLTLKLADHLDGIDVSTCHEGDVLDLPQPEAELLVAERWAVPIRRSLIPEVRGSFSSAVRAQAADVRHSRRRTVVQLRRHIEQQHGCEPHAQRRAEDRIRDDHHDAQAKTLGRSLE